MCCQDSKTEQYTTPRTYPFTVVTGQQKLSFLLPGQAKGLVVVCHERPCLSIQKGRYVQGTSPFDPIQHNAPPTISFETDTSHPPSIVPIYFVHTPEHPFCTNDFCACHHNQIHIAQLVAAIQQGEMTLKEAADFADGKGL